MHVRKGEGEVHGSGVQQDIPPPPLVHRPPGTTVPPHPGGNRCQVTPPPPPPPPGDTIANEQITGAYYADFMTDLLLAVHCPRL